MTGAAWGYQQPTEADWNKFRKYASWMRQISFTLEARVSDEVLHAISANLPNGFPCPQLRELFWVSSGNRTFNRIFVSSHLTKFRFWYCPSNIEVLADLASVMADLQTPSLQHLEISDHVPEDPILTSLMSVISSVIPRCGPSLTSVIVSVPLTDAAIWHIMQLPELTTWKTRSGLPVIESDLSAVNTFPKLQNLCLRSTEALKWLPFLGEHTHRAPSGRVTSAPRNHERYQSLTTINCTHEAPSKVDAAFISPIMSFHGLINLHLKSICSTERGCGFRLTDDDVGEFAAALPNLNNLNLGRVCSANSCETTVASLLIISACCKNLGRMKIHFRTSNLLQDLESMPNDPRLRDLFRLPRCGLGELGVSKAPLQMEQGYEQVAEGFFRIFPSISEISGTKRGWKIISGELAKSIRTNRQSANLL